MVSVGVGPVDRLARLYEEGKFVDYLYVHGLTVELAEAAADWCHEYLVHPLKWPGSGRPEWQGQPGCRFSFGYPSAPDLEMQNVLFELLGPQEIGVTLTDTCLMVPEFTVSALVALNPEARHFAID